LADFAGAGLPAGAAAGLAGALSFLPKIENATLVSVL
jgi:hypothetical protein